MWPIQEHDSADHLDEVRTTGLSEYLACFLCGLKAVRTYLDLDEFMGGEFMSDFGLQRISGAFLSHVDNGFEVVAEGA